GALAVRLAAEDAAARGHADDDRAGELAGRAVADACRLRHDLVEGRIHVIGELNLDAGLQPVGGHADGRSDDAKFGDRRVETTRAAVFLLQARRTAEDTAEIADILAEHDDLFVASHRDVHRRTDRLD